MMTVDNEFSDSFSSDFDAPVDAFGRACITVNWSGCMSEEEVGALDPLKKAMAERFAHMAIRQLTAFQVGACPVTVRPCVSRCQPSISALDARPWMMPYIRDGQWYNSCGCQPTDCSCSNLTTVRLSQVASIEEVRVGGVILDPATDYRVDNGNELVRLAGPEWPSCQDMAAGPNDEGTFFVTYRVGAALDKMGEVVAGILAKQYLDACSGGDCSLPPNVISLARQGVTMEMGDSLFPGGMTGIAAVDLWVKTWNPYAVKSPATVFSLDRQGPRQTTVR